MGDIVTKDRKERVRMFIPPERRSSKVSHRRGPVLGCVHSGERPFWWTSILVCVNTTFRPAQSRAQSFPPQMNTGRHCTGERARAVPAAACPPQYALTSTCCQTTWIYAVRATIRERVTARARNQGAGSWKTTGGGDDLPFKKHGEGKGKVPCMYVSMHQYIIFIYSIRVSALALLTGSGLPDPRQQVRSQHHVQAQRPASLAALPLAGAGKNLGT